MWRIGTAMKARVREGSFAVVFLVCGGTLLLSGNVLKAESADLRGLESIAHREVTGVISNAQPSMFFIKPTHGLQPRTISIAKAERIGLHEAKVGDRVTLLVDEGNLLVDAYRTGASAPDHRLIAGELQYANEIWEEIKLSTPDGIERYDVDSLAGSKLSLMKEGARLEVELDADNRVVYIYRGH